MVTKVHKTWKGKNIAYLFLEATLIRCLHQFIDHRCRNWSRTKILKHKQIVDYLMLRQLQRHSLRYWSKAFYFLKSWPSPHIFCFILCWQVSLSLAVFHFPVSSMPKKASKTKSNIWCGNCGQLHWFFSFLFIRFKPCLYCVETWLFFVPKTYNIYSLQLLQVADWLRACSVWPL